MEAMSVWDVQAFPASFAQRFLRGVAATLPLIPCPSLGEAGLDLILPPGTLGLVGLDHGQLGILEARYGQRVAPSKGGGSSVRFWRAPAGCFHDWDGQRDDYVLDLHADDGELWLAGWHFLARLDWSNGPLADVWTSEQRPAEFLGVVENVLRLLTAFRMLEAGGVVLHSAGVCVEGQAHLFWGYSGAGKSTLSGQALAAGFTVISDDLNVILPRDGGFWVERVPFAGDLGQTADGAEPLPLGGLHRLQKADDNRLEALSPARALAGMAACAPFVNGNPDRGGALLDNLTAILDAVPVDTVYFSLQGGIWPLLRTFALE